MTPLAAVVAENRAGAARGLPSWCTAHPETLGAIFACYTGCDAPILVEATCNQVNQTGGYTGMQPADFRDFAHGLARDAGVKPERLILGGDHLGPNPWRAEPAAAAMDKARALVTGYVEAGFDKLHLDASMRCADDDALPEATIAARAAELCAVAEAAARGRPLAYVVGTEVPVPGGETAASGTLAVTRPEALRRTLALHAEAFAARGLDAAFERVIGVVAQPGVDFDNDRVHAFDPAAAADLPGALADRPGLAFEAHSTDYQTEAALRALVATNFALLKVGPELTFTYRRAMLALAALDPVEPSRLEAVLRAEMFADPAPWRAHVAPGPDEDEALIHGLSDRVRYYWPRPAVQASLARLRANIAAARPDPELVARHTGAPVAAEGTADLPPRVVRRMVGEVVRKYRAAAGDAGSENVW